MLLNFLKILIKMQESIIVSRPKGKIKASIKLVSSKSESNRALIIKAVSGNSCILHNLSEARDTQTMLRLLSSNEQLLDVIDAGTTMRFLTAYFALSGADKILTGTARMCERPIGILVDALRTLGAQIEYLNKDGYPPIKIQPFQFSGHNHLQIKGDVSSQYISAILMSSVLLPEGIKLELTGKISSRPYIEMTLDLMRHFGVNSYWEGENVIVVPKQAYITNEYTIESDWSGASYWFSIVGLSEDAEIELIGLKENSLQGDSAIVKIMDELGVKAVFNHNGVVLTRKTAAKEAFIDFSDCPDLAQTVVAFAAAKGISLRIKGLESLRIKETDRITALQNEIGKYGATMTETSEQGYFEVKSSNQVVINSSIHIATYDDHRMAMAFAPLAMLGDITIQHPEVVQKSYPGYWNDLKAAGFNF